MDETSSKRLPRPTLPQLQGELEAHDQNMASTLMPVSSEHTPAELVEMANACRSKATAFLNTLDSLRIRLRESGAMEEAQVLDTRRKTFKVRGNNYLKTIKQALEAAECEDTCSLLSQSTSTASDISTEFPTLFQEEAMSTRLDAIELTSVINARDKELELEQTRIIRELEAREQERKAHQTIAAIQGERNHLTRARSVVSLSLGLPSTMGPRTQSTSERLAEGNLNSPAMASPPDPSDLDPTQGPVLKSLPPQTGSHEKWHTTLRLPFLPPSNQIESNHPNKGRFDDSRQAAKYPHFPSPPPEPKTARERTMLRGCPNLPPNLMPHTSFDSPQYEENTFPTQNRYQQMSEPSASASYLIRQDLFAKSANPFGGTGQEDRFHFWVSLLGNRLRGLSLSALDVIGVLMANTSGEANKLIQDFQVAGGSNPEAALALIWTKLYQRYGSGERVASSLRSRLLSSPSIVSDGAMGRKLRELADLCSIVEAQISNIPELSTLNFSEGIRPLWEKLPLHLQTRWKRRAHKHKTQNQGQHPPFHIFAAFVDDAAEEASDEVLLAHTKPKLTPGMPTSVGVYATTTDTPSPDQCFLHESAHHTIEECKAFQAMPVKRRVLMVQSKARCYRCFGSHLSYRCQSGIICSNCSKPHNVLLHTDHRVQELPLQPIVADTESDDCTNLKSTPVLCSKVCGSPSQTKTCGKTLLVEVKCPQNSERTLLCYAILDEQSDTSFADPNLLNFFHVDGPKQAFQISTLSGHKYEQRGRIAKGLEIKGVTEPLWFQLPPVFENELIPDTRSEVATPSTVRAHPHVCHLAHNFSKLEKTAQVFLLIGRDGNNLMKTEVYGQTFPFAHHTSLGWALVGSVCLQKSHAPNQHLVLKTSVDHDHFKTHPTSTRLSSTTPLAQAKIISNHNKSVFFSYRDDELFGMSQEDTKFTNEMSSQIHLNSSGSWELPLPFRTPTPDLPSNQCAVFRRTKKTLSKLCTDSEQLKQCLLAMGKSIKNQHVEKVPTHEIKPTSGQAWWLPIFPVVHPKKGKTRLVWDSSATYHGTSLNAQLLQGPNQNNSLRGVLLRFREGEIGFVADVESMFHSFHLNKEHRDFHRFYWFDDNDPEKSLVQYRAGVHIFGNKCSPAVATLALRHCISKTPDASPLACDFVRNRFYVDDGLGTANDPWTAIKTLQETRDILNTFNIRLHKIISNEPQVMAAFPSSEIAVERLDMESPASLPQRTLGVAWHTNKDKFEITTEVQNKPFTRRGILSVVNSIFDPIGLVSPISLGGRLIQRNALLTETLDSSKSTWDEPLPDAFRKPWEEWTEGLSDLHLLGVPRGFVPRGFGLVLNRQMFIFTDASKEAIGYVIYLRSQGEGRVHVAFLCGNSRVAPRSTSSIPRLELCAALEATIAAQEILEEISLPIHGLSFLTDSLVVLGYLNNQEKHFSRYVSRRSMAILSMTTPNQWHYVPSKLNPADLATRPQSPKTLQHSSWFTGPPFLLEFPSKKPWASPSPTPTLPELVPRSKAIALALKVVKIPIFQSITERISQWTRQINVVHTILQLSSQWVCGARQRLGTNPATSTIACKKERAQTMLLECAQSVCFGDLLSILKRDQKVPSSHPLAGLCPILGADGLIRVGGRLDRSKEPFEIKHPVLVPQDHPVHTAILLHYHKKTNHQGRHLTHGAIRSSGFHLQGGRQSLKKLLSSCVPCRRLRAPLLTQVMADLPQDRLEASPPFTNTGLDIFGPFLTHGGGNTTRKTKSTKKAWALLLTCLVSRAVHIEILPSMDTTSFKNALRRFVSVRGPCKVIRSDQGSNILGSLGEDEKHIDMTNIASEMKTRGCTWILNPPHASHFGGAWERKIGAIRQVLDGCLLLLGPRQLSLDELHTYLLEAAAIVNSTPLWEVSPDPNDPAPLCPSSLLTLKPDIDSPKLGIFKNQDLLAYGKRRWRRVQFLADQFWVRWREQYLQTLQERKKWVQPRKSLRAGDLVLLRSKSERRLHWPFGLVEEAHLSADGHVRSVTIKQSIKTSGGGHHIRFYDRPICDIVPLIQEAPPQPDEVELYC